ncbi:MAG: adenine deaminase [Anaerolineaceae bacterium]|nr:adenine deaminase [Anaerolineaceae bacterium]
MLDLKNTKEFEELRARFDAIMGKGPADLLIKNVKIVDVYSDRVSEGSILIKDGIILALNPPDNVMPRNVLDGEGMYVAPGLIDAHCHIDSHLITPAAFSECVTPNGTTTLICEIVDIIGSAKKDGVKCVEVLFKELEKLPYRIYLQAPGKKVTWDISRKILDMDITINQGEFAELDFLEAKDDVLEQILYAKRIGKPIHSHIKYLDESVYPVNMFAMINTYNTHNTWDYKSLQASLQLGIPSMIREGVGGVLSCIDATVPGMINDHLPTDNIMFCTDDLTVDTIFARGHINYSLNRAIGLGISPLTAIKMGTLNAARAFHMEQYIGAVAPGRFADLIFLKDLQTIKPVWVMKGGKIVAEDGRLLEIPRIDYSEIISSASPGLDDLKKEDLELHPMEISKDGTKAKIVCLFMGMPAYMEPTWVDYKDGKVIIPQGMNRMSIIQRYSKGKRKITNGLVTQFDLQKGAMAYVYSSLAQQICVVGKEVDDIYEAAIAMDQHPGGFLSWLEGKVTSLMPAQIYSLITTMTATDFYKCTIDLKKAGEKLGYYEEQAISPWYFRMQIMSWMFDRRRYVGMEDE